MARSWLTSSMLPSEYWWYMLKRATEVSNYIPIKVNGTLSFPHELMYDTKPDVHMFQ